MKIKFYNSKFGFGITYSNGEYFSRNHHLHLYFIYFYVVIVFPWKNKRSEDEIGCDNFSTYGIHFINQGCGPMTKMYDSLVIYIGRTVKYINLPWSFEWVYTAYQDINGGWVVDDYRLRKLFKKTDDYFEINNTKKYIGVFDIYYTKDFDKNFCRYHTYRYGILNQKSECKYYVCERCWRPIILKRFNIFNYKRRMIEVTFKNEMGPDVDSWKGGVIACGFDMKEGEMPEDCILRMEKEYEF